MKVFLLSSILLLAWSVGCSSGKPMDSHFEIEAGDVTRNKRSFEDAPVMQFNVQKKRSPDGGESSDPQGRGFYYGQPTGVNAVYGSNAGLTNPFAGGTYKG